jgi:hypothetical protein
MPGPGPAGLVANMTAEQIASFQYQKEHINDDRRPLVMGIQWGLWVLVVVALCLRFYAKSMIRSGLKLEDGLILFAFV